VRHLVRSRGKLRERQQEREQESDEEAPVHRGAILRFTG
jgi:hypothetical protein